MARTVSDIACGVEILGIDSMAAVLLMRDGTWQYDLGLKPADLDRARRWVRDAGPAWVAAHRADLEKAELLTGGRDG